MSKKDIIPEMKGEVEQNLGPSDADLKKATMLARTQLDLLAEADTLQKKLTEVNFKLKQNMEVDLPAVLDEIGQSEFKLSNGAVVSLQTAVQASISEANRPAAHAWLEKHKMGDLIKREIKILFGRDEVSWAKKFLADCAKRAKKLNLGTKEWVDANTLKATVKRLRADATEAGKNPDEVVPKDLFGVYVVRFASVQIPGEDKVKPVGAKKKK